MNKSSFNVFNLIFLLVALSCKQPINIKKESWQQQFDDQLQRSGHRNWILVVDKAFPQQPGMHMINTNEKLLPVLETVLIKINHSTHVKPVIYNDAELEYISDSLAPGVSTYKQQLKKVLSGASVQSLLHDSVFIRMDKAARLFSVTVLKTEEIIPYSSVFLELDCAYWGGDKEKQLRAIMKPDNNKQ